MEGELQKVFGRNLRAWREEQNLSQEAFADLLERLATSGIGILLAEQNAQMALSIAHWGYVLEQGVVALSGSGSDLRSNNAVRTAYLGMEIE